MGNAFNQKQVYGITENEGKYVGAVQINFTNHPELLSSILEATPSLFFILIKEEAWDQPVEYWMPQELFSEFVADRKEAWVAFVYRQELQSFLQIEPKTIMYKLDK